MLPYVSCCAGIFLGLYFNVLALLPFTILGGCAYLMASLSRGHGLFQSLGEVILPAIIVQGGYVIGLTCREAYGHVLSRLNLAQSKRI